MNLNGKNHLIIILLGNMGSGKSTISKELISYGFKSLQIDTYYNNTPRVDLNVDWQEDEAYRLNAYENYFKDVERLSLETDLVLEFTGGKRGTMFYKKLIDIKNVDIVVFFIKVPLDVLHSRIKTRNDSEADPRVIELEAVSELDRKLKLNDIPVTKFLDGLKPVEEITKDILIFLKLLDSDLK